MTIRTAVIMVDTDATQEEFEEFLREATKSLEKEPEPIKILIVGSGCNHSTLCEVLLNNPDKYGVVEITENEAYRSLAGMPENGAPSNRFRNDLDSILLRYEICEAAEYEFNFPDNRIRKYSPRRTYPPVKQFKSKVYPPSKVQQYVMRVKH